MTIVVKGQKVRFGIELEWIPLDKQSIGTVIDIIPLCPEENDFTPLAVVKPDDIKTLDPLTAEHVKDGVVTCLPSEVEGL